MSRLKIPKAFEISAVLCDTTDSSAFRLKADFRQSLTSRNSRQVVPFRWPVESVVDFLPHRTKVEVVGLPQGQCSALLHFPDDHSLGFHF